MNALLTLILLAQLPPVPLTDLLPLNPVDFGAVANDGQDDSAAFAQAVEKLQDGGSIVIPAGTFELGTATTCRMHITKNNTRIKGAGKDVTVLKYTSLSRQGHYASGSCIFFGGDVWGATHTGFTLEDLTIWDQSADMNVYGPAALWTNYVHNVTVQRVKFIDCKGGSMYLLGAGPVPGDGLRVEDCETCTSQKGMSNAGGMTLGNWRGVYVCRDYFHGKLARGGIEGGQVSEGFFLYNRITVEDFLYPDGTRSEGFHCMGNMALENSIVAHNVLINKHGFAGVAFNSDAAGIPAGSGVVCSENLIDTMGDGIRIQSSNMGEQRNISITRNHIKAPYCVAIYYWMPKGILEVSGNLCDFRGYIGEVVAGPGGTPAFTDPNGLVMIRANTICGDPKNPGNPPKLIDLVRHTGWRDARIRIAENFGKNIPEVHTTETNGSDSKMWAKYK